MLYFAFSNVGNAMLFLEKVYTDSNDSSIYSTHLLVGGNDRLWGVTSEGLGVGPLVRRSGGEALRSGGMGAVPPAGSRGTAPGPGP